MKKQIRFQALNHAAFATNDMEMTVHFWRDLLGMKLVAAMGQPGNRQYFFSVSSVSFITFFEWPHVSPVPYKHHGSPIKGPFIFDHLSIGVESRHELFHIQDLLEENELPVSDVIDHGFIHSLYTYDPNGIPLEFSWITGRVDLIRHPAILDPEPPLCIQEEGTDPVEGYWRVPEPTPEEEWIVIPGTGHEMVPPESPGE